MAGGDEHVVSDSFLKRKSAAIIKQLNELKNVLTTEYLSGIDEAGLMVRLELVDRLQKNFETVQDSLEMENPDEIDSNAREQFLSVFIEVKSSLTRKLNFRRSSNNPQSSTVRQLSMDEAHPSFIVSQPKARLPVLTVPIFSGDYTEWPDFLSMFQAVFGNDADLTQIEKFQYLRSSLRESALDTIRSLEISDNNYEIALSMLKNRFDNKRLNFQAHIRDIYALTKVESGDVSKLRELSDGINSHLRALEGMGTKEQLADCLLIHLIANKLDVASQTKWEEQTPVNTLPTWSSMSTFLEKRCQTLENVENAMVIEKPSKQVSKKSIQNMYSNRKAFVASNNNAKACVFCNSYEHAIQNCPQFSNLSPSLRFKETKRLQVCLNCLKKGHFVKDCKSRCCRYCSSKHHSLLHLNHGGTHPLSAAPEELPSTSMSSNSALISTSRINHPNTVPPNHLPENCVFIATAIVLVKNRAGSFIPCRTILDSASQLHCITSRIVNQLQLKRTKSTTLISGIGESDLVANESVDIFIRSRVSEFTAAFSAIVVPTITNNQPSYTINNIDWNIPSNIELADPSFFKSQRIDMLIGASQFFELMCVGQIRLSGNLPLLQKTRLGWVVSGGGHSSIENLSCLTASKNISSELSSNDSLHDLVKAFWEVEDHIVTESNGTKDELKCERHFTNNVIRLESGGYSVRLPSRLCPTLLGDSYQQAVRRFENLEKRLNNNCELKRQYSEFIKEYADLNHMSFVKSLPPGIPAYFLPHHCVLKADSTTTKLRVVFDGSATTSSGYSLNDILFAGPTIQPKLFDILLRFRSFKIALTADICKMYRCVRVSYPDNYLQCVLWRDNPHDPIQMFKLDTVTYGTKPAAFLAIRAMHQLASDEETAFPIGAKIVRRDFYVDDMISGGNSIEEVVEILKQTTTMLELGNFKLRKWCTSNPKVLKQVPESDKEQFLKFHDGTDVTKTLGLVWDPKTDNFLFSFIPFVSKQQITKRSVLSFIARFYDPLGLIGPVIVKAKIFLQVLWKEKVNWDESLPQSLQSTWTHLCADFQSVDSFRISRFVMAPNSKIQIHAFCDASLLAYGVCIYVRSERKGCVWTNLLCSKSRVSPLKTLTVPKLELSAAMLLAELTHSISSMAIFRGEIHCWSDSTVVLHWLREEPSSYNVFVANRVTKIQALTKEMTWHYVPSSMNPADILSRGASPKDLGNSSLWNHGPPFLQNIKRQWPICPALVEDVPERRKRVLLSTNKIEDFSIGCRYVNSFWKMQRIYAYIYRFRSRLSHGPLTIAEIQQGTYFLLRMVQRVNFYTEYRAFEKKKKLDSSNILCSLNPFLDSNGLLRVGGRLQNTTLDFEAKHPIILPKKHALTNSIIDYFHRKFLHAGPQSLLASIRLQYWPIGGRKTVNRVINKCIRCFRLKPKFAEHIMGNLPVERVQANRTFFVTGIDYCGPFYYKSEIRNRAPVKCYICLFICFATKAIHLELVKDLSTPAFLAALKRFICTRGRPKTIWSDNATNFVGAKNELADLRKLFLSDGHTSEIQQQCLEDGIEWKFIPPRSPHFGGLWEASIKLAKFHFWRTVALANFNFEELRTLVCQISAIINSRPLCPITENPEDLDVLTPAHFLVGAPFTSIIEPDVTALNTNRLGRWQRVCYIQQLFWKKWSTEYLTTLQQRNKWQSSTSNIAVGNMVLLRGENLPPLQWPLARVIEIIKGADGVARIAVVRTSSGTTRRAVAKLCVLPIDDNSVESLNLSTGGGCSE